MIASAPSATSSASQSLLRSTLVALAMPRRAIAVLVVAIPLVVVQVQLSAARGAGLLGGVMCIACLVFAPVAWRALFPAGLGHRPTWSAPFGRLVVYAVTGAGVVSLVGIVVPRIFGVGPTLMTSDPGLVVSLGLFLVGGYGLGHDIDQQSDLDRTRAALAAVARQAEHARLLALRRQLDPHFLFNTLNAIAEWCREDGVVAEQAILRLSEMLRTMLEASRLSTWSIARELDLCRMLFDLHAVRDPGTLHVTWKLDEPLPAIELPPMLLLPLCENAMKHGIVGGVDHGIEVGVVAQGTGARVWISNAGEYRGPRSAGEGVASVRHRLVAAYGSVAALEIEARENRVHATIVLPVAVTHRDSQGAS